MRRREWKLARNRIGLAVASGVLTAWGVLGWEVSTFSDRAIRPWRQALQGGDVILVFLGIALFALFWQTRRARYPRRVIALRRTARRIAGQEILERLPVASYVVPMAARDPVWQVSPEVETLLGYSRTVWDSDARFWAKIVHPDDRERLVAERARALEMGEHFFSEYRVTAYDGRLLWLHDEAVLIQDDSTGEPYQHGVLIDVTERKRFEQALEHQALHDALTDLPNRTLLCDRLQQVITVGRREAKPAALLLMDLDRFKEINDTLGHHCGDLVLRQVVTRLRRELRESDTIARLGGDEFAVLLPGVDERGALHAVGKILQSLSIPLTVEGHTLDVGASIGAAIYPDHARDAHTLLQRADVAMYTAKRTQDGYALYEPDDDPYTPDRLSLARFLRDAIEQDRLELHYQPKARLDDGRIQHLEALIRWRHPERGYYLPPEQVIALAEHSGLMKSLSYWALNAALRQSYQWQDAGLDVSVAVNLSPRTLHDPDLVPTIERLLARWKARPERLEVEVTEGGLMVNPSGALDTLTRLKSMGVAISIDDFGTGYSSLSYLTRLPANQIKIDKSFVLDMVRNDDSAYIVRSVIDLGHNLSLEVVAEGVEDQATWDLLASMGCDVAQGYHVSRPLPAVEMWHWMSRIPRPMPLAATRTA